MIEVPGARLGPGAARSAGRALGLIALLALAAPGDDGGGGTLKIVAELDRSACLVGGELTLRLRLENDGAAAVELPDPSHAQNWQPTYTVVGPAHPAGVTFSHRSVRQEEFGPPQDDPVLVRLEPGARLEGELPLHEWCPITAPGTYQVTARLVWGGVDVTSAPATFVVEAPHVTSAALGSDPGGSLMIWSVWAHAPEGAAGARLHDAVWLHERDGAEPVSQSPLGAPAGPAARVLSVATNFDRGDSLFRWRAWLEGQTLRAVPTQEPHVAEHVLDAGAQVVRPLLMTAEATLDAFALLEDGGLSLVRFPRPNDDLTVTAPRELWRVALPAPPAAATCALGASGEDSRFVLLVTQDARGLVLDVLRAAGSKGPLASGPSVREAGARLLAGSQPGLRVDGDGIAEAALLVESEGQLTLLTVRFDPEDPHPVGRTTHLGALPPEVVEAAVACDPRDVAPEAAWSWAALLSTGKLLHGGAEQDLGGPVVRPLQLVRFEWPYVLVAPPGRPPIVIGLP